MQAAWPVEQDRGCAAWSPQLAQLLCSTQVVLGYWSVPRSACGAGTEALKQ